MATPVSVSTPSDRRALLYELFTVAVSPGRQIRVDPAGEHAYDESVPVPATAPDCPHVVYLTHGGRFRLLVFDLDATKHGAQAVLDDLALVRRWLDEAGIDHLVARSGPSGGRHVWIRVPDGVDAQLAAELATRLRGGGLVTLDSGLLRNPRRACARPPGALHRRGGHSELDPAVHGDGHVVTDQEVRAAARTFMRGTSAAVVRSLIHLIPAPSPTTAPEQQVEAEAGDAGLAEARSVRDRRVRVVTDGQGMPYLDGRRRPLSARMTARLTEKPGRDDFGGHGYSALLHSVLVGAALSCWQLADVLPWLEDRSITAVEHCRSERRGDGNGRDPRTPARVRKELVRAWEKAVLAAVDLPITVPVSPEEETRIGEVLATVAAVEEVSESVAWRWSGAAGPADQAALKAACYIAVRGRTLRFSLDCRRWSELTGHGRSTMHRAARRLSEVDDSDRSWLRQVDPGDESHAATWELLPQTVELSPVDRSGTQREPSPRSPRTGSAVQGEAPRLKAGETSEVPNPVLRITSVNTEVIACSDSVQSPATCSLQDVLEGWLGRHGHDVWTYGDGLGHHVARVYWAIEGGRGTADEIAAVTGYSLGRTRLYLRRLHDHRLTRSGRDRVTALGGLDRAARVLGVEGTSARRARRHLVERALHAWWIDEQAWRSRPGKRGRGPRRPDPGQVELGVVELGPRARFGPFPTRSGPGVRGRADYPAAMESVCARLGIGPGHTGVA